TLFRRKPARPLKGGDPVANSTPSSANDCVTPTQATPPGRSSALWLVIIVIAAVILGYKIYASPSTTGSWSQNYDPLGRLWLSPPLAALPVIVPLGPLAFLHVKAHYAAPLGPTASLCCAIWIFGMPARMAAKTAVLGACYGLFPIGWIILNIIFMYQLS